MLTLKIANFQDVKAEYGQVEMHKTFSELGGFIGRSAQCEWSLRDDTRKISSKHAVVEFQYGDFFITDISTNGTKLNGLGLDKNHPTKIKEGDVFELGLYRILVANILKDKAHSDIGHIINPTSVNKNQSSDNMSFLEEAKLSDNANLPFDYAESSNVHASRDSFSQLEMSNEFSLEQLSSTKKQEQLEQHSNDFDDKNYNEFVKIEEGEDSAHMLQIDDDFDFVNKIVEPEPPLPKQTIAEDKYQADLEYEKSAKPETIGSTAHHRRVEPEQNFQHQQRFEPKKETFREPGRAPQQSCDEDFFLQTICQKTGLSYNVIKQLDKKKIYSDIADILTYSMDGIIRLMMERNNAKNKLDSDLTMFTSQVKNPLKMSMTSKQALETILFDTNESIMPARQAVGESISEIVGHFKKVDSSTRDVISMFVDSFDPETIEKDTMQSGRVLPGMLATKCWSKHKIKYMQMFGNTEKQKNKNIKEYISEKYNS